MAPVARTPSKPPARLPRTSATPSKPLTPARRAASGIPKRKPAADPKRVLLESPSSPVPTPRRASSAKPRSILRKPSDAGMQPQRTPKRAAGEAKLEQRGLVKRRIVGEVAESDDGEGGVKRTLSDAAGTAAVKGSKSKAASSTPGKNRSGLGRAVKPSSASKVAGMAKRMTAGTSEHATVKGAVVRGGSTQQSKSPAAGDSRGVKPGKAAKSTPRSKSPKSPKQASVAMRKKSSPGRVRFAEDDEGQAPRSSNLSDRNNTAETRETPGESQYAAARGSSSGVTSSKSPKSPKINSGRKNRPKAGRFDLRLPEEGDEMVLAQAPSAAIGPDSESEADSGDRASPEITFNEEMTESKLKLLQSSPLNRLIPEKDRMAAAAEVAAKKVTAERQAAKRKTSSDAGEELIPVHDVALPEERNEGGMKTLDSARRKEERKFKWKARQMKMRGELPTAEKPSSKAGVVYLGHIPHGFYEKEMRAYFSQFGEVTRLRLSRSKKTARSRGYAFVEFADEEVASIAATAMDGYLMHGQALVAKLIPQDKHHADMFKGANRTFRKIPWSALERRGMISRAANPLKLAARSRRVQKSAKGKKKSLLQKGLKYDFPEIASAS